MQLSDKRAFCHQRSAFIQALKDKGYLPSSYIERKGPQGISSHFLGPTFDELCSIGDLENINTGEAHWRVDWVLTLLHHYTNGVIHNKWHDYPNIKKATPTPAEAREWVQDLLVFGYEFEYGSKKHPSYGVCSLIDYANPMNNKMRYAKCWPGVLDDGFAWDLILMVNSMPLIAVIFSKKEDFATTARTASYQLNSDPCFGAFAFWIVVTDGHESCVGTPQMKPESWHHMSHVIEELLTPNAFMEKFVNGFCLNNDEQEGDSDGK